MCCLLLLFGFPLHLEKSKGTTSCHSRSPTEEIWQLFFCREEKVIMNMRDTQHVSVHFVAAGVHARVVSVAGSDAALLCCSHHANLGLPAAKTARLPAVAGHCCRSRCWGSSGRREPVMVCGGMAPLKTGCDRAANDGRSSTLLKKPFVTVVVLKELQRPALQFAHHTDGER